MTQPTPQAPRVPDHAALAHYDPELAVVKLGSAVLTTELGRLDEAVLNCVADFAAERLERGRHTLVVSSGAIASGIGEMGLDAPPTRLPRRQALAAVGQSRLMAAWREAFLRRGRKVAQILVSADDFRDRRRYLNMRYTLDALFEMGVVPIVNENDTVTVEELRFGENDGLAQLLAIKMMAGLLVFLTNVGGLYEKLPEAGEEPRLVPLVADVNEELLAGVSARGSAIGRGGMRSKLQAAGEAARAGVPVLIAPGKDPEVFHNIFSGLGRCTLVPDRPRRGLSRRQRFIAHSRLKPRGTLVVDEGAARAVTAGKKSLLPAGVISSEGRYERGYVVDVRDQGGRLLARGLVNYDHHEVARIKGHRSCEIEGLLGVRDYDEIIHRDNLVVIEENAS